ncbi:MAG: hypothetical protein EA401_00040 [Planctomycetota bacterium]|nr:MAG: hypothetical protein EA401_00040 [Planctomycetota bacterium]
MNSPDISLAEQSLVVHGNHIPLDTVIHAEASQIEDWTRLTAILLVALVGPIAAMTIATLTGGSQSLGMWFGPVLFVVTAGLGVLGGVIGYVWHKPWGVIVERKEFGHSTLMRCANKDEAESWAERIRNDIIAKRPA